MSANDKQIAGSHYKQTEGEQHWDRIWRMYGRGYFVGCATKYIERYHLKNGKEDLEKAIHFLQKLIELEYGGEVKPTSGSLEDTLDYVKKVARPQREIMIYGRRESPESYEGDATTAYVGQD